MTCLGIGIDTGGTFTKLVLADGQGRVLSRYSIPTRTAAGPRAFLKNLCRAVEVLSRGRPVRAVGMGIAGDFEAGRGLLRFSPNLSRWRNIPIASMMRRLIRKRIVVDNDANMAAWGAYAVELKRRYPNVLAVTLGTGVGGGIVLGRKLYVGSTGSAGEIGHTKVSLAGERCHCGNRGCLEAYVGSYGILRRARRKIRVGSTQDLAVLARKGNAVARRIWEETGTYLGIGLANLGCVLNPDYICLTGGVSGAGSLLLRPVRRVLRRQAMASPFRWMRVGVARVPDLGAVGAAVYALENEDR